MAVSYRAAAPPARTNPKKVLEAPKKPEYGNRPQMGESPVISCTLHTSGVCWALGGGGGLEAIFFPLPGLGMKIARDLIVGS